MLYKSQKKLFEKHAPEGKLGDDVFFYGGNLFTCEQQQGRTVENRSFIEKDDGMEDLNMNVFFETLNLQKIHLTKVMDM